MTGISEAREQYISERSLLFKRIGDAGAHTEALARAGDPGVIEAVADSIRATAEMAILLNAAQIRPISMPGLPTLYYYMGISDELGRLKYGITKDLKKRQTALRRNMVGLGFTPDFEMFDWVVGEEREVRATEQEGFRLLKEYRRGGEWFELNAEAVWEWQFTSAQHLDGHLRQCLRDLDVEKQIQQAIPETETLFPVLGLTRNETPEEAIVRRLVSLWRQWEKARGKLFAKDWNAP